jgi:phospholipase C
MEGYAAARKPIGQAPWRLAPLWLVVALFLIPTHLLAEDGGHHKLDRVNHIIVVYQENWSFDSLYGLFP